MSEQQSGQGRVAVYIDFDNVVISRAKQNGISSEQATVDLGAILDFASSFGAVAISRAYADWSAKQNADYHDQLVDRAVSLVQLFNTTARLKNGADIRLAIDAVEDLGLFADITHLVIVAGDSDYIPLAQHARRHGRYVVGIGVAGSISKYLMAACDEYWDYDGLPGLGTIGDDDDSDAADGPAVPDPIAVPGRDDAPAPRTPAVSKSRATQLLLRAIEFADSRSDQDWHTLGGVKNQILRMEPAFQESALGFSKFSDFVRSRAGLVELNEKKNTVRLRARPPAPGQ